MQIVMIIVVLMLSYLIGAVPSGLIVVKTFKNIDLRHVESGRTGGTNAGRAAGFLAGALTAILDFLKGAITVWLAQHLVQDLLWLHVAAPLLAILGHNYSVFLMERTPEGKLRLRGGAGGAPCLGGAFGLFPPSLLIILPIGLVVLLGIGYASLTTLSVAFLAIVLFTYRAVIGVSPWIYVLYGSAAEVLLVIALLPNIRRLLQGNERVVGLRVWLKKQKPQTTSSDVETNGRSPL